MYRHCLFCHADLGANERIEAFPVGRRLAFDPAKGRLWVVCNRCGQWNLTPLEERWEAVETCERLFRDTRRRLQSENVGLARPDEHLTLVRIGRPALPEFAAWRYGDQFGRRRRTALLIGGGASVGAAALVAGVAAAAGPGLPALLFVPLFLPAALVHSAGGLRTLFTRTRLPDADGGEVVVTSNERPFVRLVEASADDGGWALVVPFQRRVRRDERWWAAAVNGVPEGTMRLTGPLARRAAAQLLPSINPSGAPASRVRDALTLLDEAGGAERWFAEAARRTRSWAREATWGDTGALRFLPAPARLALEMAAHEETERRALEGELAELEARWREAEEIAAIADDLVLPDRVRAWLAARRSRDAES